MARRNPAGSQLWSLWTFGFTATVYVAFRLVPFRFDGSAWDEGLLKMALWVVPVALALRVAGLRSYGEVARELGLRRSPAAGYAFGFVAMLPMLAAMPFGWGIRESLPALVGSAVLGPFAEEVLFRGFLFRQLMRRARWNAVAAMSASALVFGLAHLANIDLALPGGVQTGVIEVATTAGGGLLFAWVTLRWGSLWPAIGLHTFMNLSWQLFAADSAAARSHLDALVTSPSVASLARAASVALAAGITLWQVRRSRLVPSSS